MEKLALLIPIFPLAGFLYIIFFGKGLSKNMIGWIACSTIFLSFVSSILVFIGQQTNPGSHVVPFFDWINSGDFKVNFAFLVDPLSSVYLLFITGVGFLIHLYSIGYMHDDEGFDRFMSYLNFFVFFMLILVLGNSYLTMFVGWEGVGLCSFMLIGFWYKDMKNNDAAKKAFIMNRIGDLGFILGMVMLFSQLGTINFDELYLQGRISSLGGDEATAIAVLFFIGAMGKSAQIPLHTWLPDAMAGPTPVSALIHAATMVTAGVFMVARSSELFMSSEAASNLVTWAGIATAILGATIALTQNDIKKVLAYSTVSQLGLMFVALGMGAYTIAVFHVITHAFFKALLFLGSGSVIHAMGGEQDVRRMGGLKKFLPTTHWTFLVGCLAISGILPFAGFFSKDQIIAHSWEHNKVIFILACGVSLLTAFYMFRLYFLTFSGKFRGTHDQEHHLHESPKTMTIPLIVLAVMSIIGGFIGFPHALGETIHVHHWLDHFLGQNIALPFSEISVGMEVILMLVATLIAVAGIGYAWNIYEKKKQKALEDDEVTAPTHRMLLNKYYLDEIYDAVVRKPVDRISSFLSGNVETPIIDNAVDGTGRTAKYFGAQLRLLQNGKLNMYILAMVIGIIALLLWGR